MKKLAFIAAIMALLSSFVATASVFATSAGQLAGGPDIYQARNVTKNTAYGSTVAVACNETVKYSFKLSNTEYGLLSNVTVKASLAGGSATATATNAANETVSTSGTVITTLEKNSLSYVAGSTKLYDVNGGLIKDLADGITDNGVNTGNLNGSTRAFVQFEAKLKCDVPETPAKIQVCDLTSKQIITIDEKAYDASKHSRDLSKCKEVPPIKVCELSTKKVIKINENDFDENKYTRDLSKCEVVPTTPVTSETPEVIPATGPVAIIAQMIGLGSLAAASTAYIRSRKLLG